MCEEVNMLIGSPDLSRKDWCLTKASKYDFVKKYWNCNSSNLGPETPYIKLFGILYYGCFVFGLHTFHMWKKFGPEIWEEISTYCSSSVWIFAVVLQLYVSAKFLFLMLSPCYQFDYKPTSYSTKHLIHVLILMKILCLRS